MVFDKNKKILELKQGGFTTLEAVKEAERLEEAYWDIKRDIANELRVDEMLCERGL